MSKREHRMHLDATRAAGDLHTSLCGFVGVQTTSDASRATCRACLARLRRGARAPASRRVLTGAPHEAALLTELHLAVAEAPSLAPSAGPPPRLSPAVWQASCRGGEHRHCGECALCLWERDARMWSHVAPWTRELRPERSADAPRWPSLDTALLALVEHERTGRTRSSMLGGLLERMARGDVGGERDPRKVVERTIVVATDVVDVQRALERAYAAGSPPLSPADCARVLLERTPSALAGVTTYEALAARYGVSEGLLRSVVKHGRAVITEDLVGRGLIPAPRVRARPHAAATSSAWRAVDAAQPEGTP